MQKEIKEGIYEIKELFAKGEYKNAYNLCNKYLLNFPENSVLKNLQSKIEKTVYEQNIQSVKKDLKKLKPLWKQNKYKELIEKLKKLQSYVPGYSPIEKQLKKALKLYNKHTQNQIKDYYKHQLKEIERLINEKDYENAFFMAKKLYKKFPQQKEITNMLDKTQDLYIDDQLKKNDKLLSSDKFSQIETLLNELLKIDPDSKKIKSLLRKVMKRERISIEFKEKTYIYKSFERIRTLYQKRKYEEALKALDELLKVEPHNLKALELRQKAYKKFKRQLTKEVIEKIIRLQKKFKKEYRHNKKEFIKI